MTHQLTCKECGKRLWTGYGPDNEGEDICSECVERRKASRPSKRITHYTLTPVYEPDPNSFLNASVGWCLLCGGVATSMGGSHADVCKDCGDIALEGYTKGAVVWDKKQ